MKASAMSTWKCADGEATFEDRWPLVVLTVRGHVDGEVWTQVLATNEAFLMRGRCVLVVDALAATTFSSEQRRLLFEWRVRTLALCQTRSMGVAYVIKSALVRGLLKATFFVRRPVWPFIIVENLPIATEWAEAKVSLATLQASA
jgi:hypothetical protein